MKKFTPLIISVCLSVIMIHEAQAAGGNTPQPAKTSSSATSGKKAATDTQTPVLQATDRLQQFIPHANWVLTVDQGDQIETTDESNARGLLREISDGSLDPLFSQMQSVATQLQTAGIGLHNGYQDIRQLPACGGTLDQIHTAVDKGVPELTDAAKQVQQIEQSLVNLRSQWDVTADQAIANLPNSGDPTVNSRQKARVLAVRKNVDKGLLQIAQALYQSLWPDRGSSFQTLLSQFAANPVGDCSQSGPDKAGIQWVPFSGGTFTMGQGSSDRKYGPASGPAHSATVKPFEMSKTVVTMGQYQKCVNAGKCAPCSNVKSYCQPSNDPQTRSGMTCSDASDVPVVCATWEQAHQFAKWADARFPSEAEWEYAARGGGKNQPYPWGNDPPDCDHVVAAFANSSPDAGNSQPFWSCYPTDLVAPVCSKPKGNTAQGLCDMEGNTVQWVQDKFHNNYIGAPTDGSAWESGNETNSQADPKLKNWRMIRGTGGYGHDVTEASVYDRDTLPADTPPDNQYPVAIRLARDVKNTFSP